MEIRQLRYLVALSQELSFTGAATRAKVAQPALSRQIRKLEDELGVVLVDRTSRRVRMTAAGQQLVQRATVILDELAAARADVLQVAQLTSGYLSIGVTQTPGPLDIAGLLREFHTLHPGIELAVREGLSIAIADRLRSDEIDVGFVSEISQAARRGLELRRIAAEPLVVALGPEHQLAARRDIGFDELKDEAFVLFPEGATVRDTFDRLAAAHAMSPNVAFVTTDTHRMRELVSIGMGVSLLPQSDALRPGPAHATVLISDEQLTYNVYMATRATRRRSGATTALTSLVDAGPTKTGD